ncbi:hypothetical protein J28TS4_05290 [Paenibacillus lautus]|nr:hypothetical protein J28TS4_05290 [Paenibacillus lautus]
MKKTCTLDNCAQTKTIKDVRVLKGLSIDSAAKKIGIEKELLILYEDNPEYMPVTVAKRIASAYNVHYDYILFI